ncbi:MAG: PspC domain-containing protein, partial [Eggerthellaceae bacterium]|nr:PspC domain-containing protein [Eggerthellaceae bacterium]
MGQRTSSRSVRYERGKVATRAADNAVCRSCEASLGGVCAGLAERFDLDPIVVRIL